MSEEIKNIGFEYDVEFKDGKATITGKHVGQDGGVELKAYLSAENLIGKGLDYLEEKIPGDQKAIVAALKALVKGIKL